MSRKMRGTLLRASAACCIGIAESPSDLLHSQTLYLNVAFG